MGIDVTWDRRKSATGTLMCGTSSCKKYSRVEISGHAQDQEILLHTTGVALMEISAYSTHKNLAVSKIMGVMHMQRAGCGLKTHQTTRQGK